MRSTTELTAQAFRGLTSQLWQETYSPVKESQGSSFAPHSGTAPLPLCLWVRLSLSVTREAWCAVQSVGTPAFFRDHPLGCEAGPRLYTNAFG